MRRVAAILIACNEEIKQQPAQPWMRRRHRYFAGAANFPPITVQCVLWALAAVVRLVSAIASRVNRGSRAAPGRTPTCVIADRVKAVSSARL